jgi:ribosomal protein S6
MNKRAVKYCAPGHECTPEEIRAILDEHIAVESDETIAVYTYPTVEEMQNIVAVAESYTGEWYHSKVTLTPDNYSGLQKELSDKIKYFEEDKGIYVLYQYDIDPETTKALEEIFAKTHNN